MNTKAVYIKPKFEYWTAAELDVIRATMSGGGGGGGPRLKWADKWTITGSEGDYSLELGIVAGLISLIATKNLSFSYQLSGMIASNIAAHFVSQSLPVIYFIRHVQHLYMYAGTAMGGYEVWDLVGSAVRSEYYGYGNFTDYAGAIEFNTVPYAYSYALSALSW